MPHRITAIVLFALSLVACPPTVKVSFFNGTAHTVVITRFDEATSIPPTESREFRVHAHEARLAIYSPAGLQEYSLSLRGVSHDFRNFWGGLVRLQLEPDGRIFILERGQHPSQPLTGVEQPPGFPLEPEQGRGAA